MQDKEFGTLLVKMGYISPEQLKIAEEVQLVQACDLVDIEVVPKICTVC